MEQKTVKIYLPGIKAVSRNQTTGHFYHYYDQLATAEKWMWTYGKRLEYHFEKPVTVDIVAYYKDTRTIVSKNNNVFVGKINTPDVPNIDDKIFTDVLVRWKRQKKGPPIERSVWFIEDDNPSMLKSVTKTSIPGDQYGVLIIIKEVPVADIG